MHCRSYPLLICKTNSFGEDSEHTLGDRLSFLSITPLDNTPWFFTAHLISVRLCTTSPDV